MKVGFLLPLCVQEFGILIACLYCCTWLFITYLYSWNLIISYLLTLWIPVSLFHLSCRYIWSRHCYYIALRLSLCRVWIQQSIFRVFFSINIYWLLRLLTYNLSHIFWLSSYASLLFIYYCPSCSCFDSGLYTCVQLFITFHISTIQRLTCVENWSSNQKLTRGTIATSLFLFLLKILD